MSKLFKTKKKIKYYTIIMNGANESSKIYNVWSKTNNDYIVNDLIQKLNVKKKK